MTRPRSGIGALLGTALLSLLPGGSLFAQDAARDVAHLGRAPSARMHALLERTFLRIDVLTLDVCFDDRTADAMRRAYQSREQDGGDDVEDALVAAALGAEEALGVIEFKREIDLEQFLDGIAEDHGRAVRAGFLADSTRVALAGTLPSWYGFLAERRVRKGDRIYYRFHSDSVRSTYLGVEGELHLDRVAVGGERRASVLGAWFAPGSSFRDDLIDSLIEDEGEREATLRQCRTAADLPPPAGSSP